MTVGLKEQFKLYEVSHQKSVNPPVESLQIQRQFEFKNINTKKDQSRQKIKKSLSGLAKVNRDITHNKTYMNFRGFKDRTAILLGSQ